MNIKGKRSHREQTDCPFKQGCVAGEGHLSEAVVGTQQGPAQNHRPKRSLRAAAKGGRTIQYRKCGHTPIPTPEAWLRAQIYKQMLISVEKSIGRGFWGNISGASWL